MNIKLYCEASQKIGVGHLKRCQTLNNLLASYSYNSELIVKCPTILKEWHKDEKDYHHTSLSEDISLDKIILSKNDILILDISHSTYLKNTSYISSLIKKWNNLGVNIALIDGLKNESLGLRISSGEFIHILPYTGVNTAVDKPDFLPETNIIYGPDYFILPESYHQVHPIKIKEKAKKTLITFGGSDPKNSTINVLEALSSKFEDMQFNVVVGPAFSKIHITSLLIKEKNSNNIKLHMKPNNLQYLYEVSDIAVIAPGTSKYEIACYGIPSIHIPTDEASHFINKTFIDSGSATTLNHNWSDKTLTSVFYYLTTNFNFRKKMNLASSNLIDGYGAERLIKQLMSTFNL